MGKPQASTYLRNKRLLVHQVGSHDPTTQMMADDDDDNNDGGSDDKGDNVTLASVFPVLPL